MCDKIKAIAQARPLHEALSLMKTPSFRLDNKKALVLGASSGIGRGCAVALAEYGANVTVVARRQSQLGQTIQLIKQYNSQAQAVVLDVTDREQTEQTIKALSQNSPFDILVNAVGTARHKPALDTSEKDFDEVMQLNLKSAYFATQVVAHALITHKKPGSLIHISSQMGHVGGVDRSVYCATKHALEGMTKALAIEWGKYHIRINTICPTFIKTEMTASTFESAKCLKWIKEKIKLKRIGEVEDIMGAVVFLASDASALITGTSLLVDGGWTAG